MQVDLMVCSQSAVIDQQSNAMSVFNILQEVNSPAFPFAIPGFTIASMYSRDENERDDPTDVRIRITLGEIQIGDFPMVLQFQGRQNLRHIVNIQAILIVAPGNLVTTIRCGEHEIASWRVVIKNIGNPAAEAAPGQ